MAYVFFDPIPGGHRPQHVLAFCRYLANRPDVRVLFAVHPDVQQQANESFDFSRYPHLQVAGLPVSVTDAIRRDNKDVRGGLRGIRAARELAREHGFRHIHFMHVDTFLPALTVRAYLPQKGITYSGLYFRPTIHYRESFASELNSRERLLDRIKYRCLKAVLGSEPMKAMLSLDPYFCSSPSMQRYSDKLFPISDLASPPSSATRPDDVPKAWLDRPVRLYLFGLLSSRKGLFALINALQELPADVARQVALLMSGKVWPPERPILQESLGQLRQRQPNVSVDVIDRYISDEELWWLLEACTMVTMPYQRHIGFSGVMCWAAAANRPILTQSFGLVGHETEKHSLGYAVDTADPAAIAAAIADFANGGVADDDVVRRRREFATMHTEDNFAKETFAALETALGDQHRT